MCTIYFLSKTTTATRNKRQTKTKQKQKQNQKQNSKTKSKCLQKLNLGFTKTDHMSKYLSRHEKQYSDFVINQVFKDLIQSFFYYLKIKDYSVMIGSKKFFNIPKKTMEENYDISRNIAVDQGYG